MLLDAVRTRMCMGEEVYSVLHNRSVPEGIHHKGCAWYHSERWDGVRHGDSVTTHTLAIAFVL